MAIREKVFSTIINVFKRHGAVTIDTPTFELKDFDIAGDFECMLADAEAIKTTAEALLDLDIGRFSIKINNRKLLDGIFSTCGVPSSQFKSICSSIDKLDKVRKEIVETKQLSGESADKIGYYVQMSGNKSLLESLASDQDLMQNYSGKQGVEELGLLYEYLEVLEVEDVVTVDLSLARGLDYYTGTIFEAILCGSELGVGSIAGGGRYDDLVNMFSGPGHKIPCVGFSIGIERIFTIIETQQASKSIVPKVTPTQIIVTSAGDSFLKERLSICSMLWRSNIPAETPMKSKPKILDVMANAEKNQIPLVGILGRDEIDAGSIRIKTAGSREEKGTLVPLSTLCSYVKGIIASQ